LRGRTPKGRQARRCQQVTVARKIKEHRACYTWLNSFRDGAVKRPRLSGAEIEARKGNPLPSDHAPLVIDIDSLRHPFDAGWSSADSRIAARLGTK
jgi:hypothetical protein